MIKLAYLVPNIMQAILDGTQPASLTLADRMKRNILAAWTDQRRAFGFLHSPIFQSPISSDRAAFGQRIQWRLHPVA